MMEIVRYRTAGGIVIDGDDFPRSPVPASVAKQNRGKSVLLLRKPALGEVVLPKGHIEPGETPEQTAIRETMEETGYRSLRVLADLGTEQAQYVHNGKQYFRDETYFLMALGDHGREPAQGYDDAEHDRTTFELMWTPLDQAAGRLSFEPARTFVRRAVEQYRKADHHE